MTSAFQPNAFQPNGFQIGQGSAGAGPTFVAAWARNCNAMIGDDESMKKNVAGQKIGGQMCSATDGSAFTGAVTVYVTVDAGAQAVGSVGAGACVHEGNGYHTYSPAQAETNGDLVAYTFIGSGAIPSTVQVATTFPQTGDSFGLIGTAGAGLTNINLPDQTMNITGDITGSLSGSVGSVSGAVGSVTGNVGGNVTGSVGSVTGLTASNLDVASSTLATAANLAIVAAYLDTEIAAIKAKTDNLPASPAATGDAMTLTGAAVDAVLDDVVEGTTTLRQMLRGFASALLGKASGLATATAVFRDVGDTKDRITATVDANGNRTAVTLDLT